MILDDRRITVADYSTCTAVDYYAYNRKVGRTAVVMVHG